MNAYDYNRAAADFRPALVTRVLVADDSAEFLAAASEVIAASEGFALDGMASSGEEAVELAGLRPPDLALIDLNMPGIGGREAAARIASACPDTAIVLMTSEPGRSTTSAALFDKSRLSPKTLAELAKPRGVSNTT